MNEESLEPAPAPPAGKKRPSLRLIVVVMLGILSLILVLQNTETVETRLFFTTVAMPRAVLLAITFLLGVTVGLLMAFVRKRGGRGR